MKKRILALSVACIVVFSMTACGKSSEKKTTRGNNTTADDTTADNSSNESSGDISEETSGVAEDDGLTEVETPYGTVKLAEYKGLTATLEEVEVTDDDVEEDVRSYLSDYCETTEISGPAREDTVVYVNMTASVDGETVLEYLGDDTYDIWLGVEEFGSEFDDAIEGSYVGDHIDLTVDFDDDYEAYYLDVDFAGKTVDFSIDIASITVDAYPELTDELAQEVGYESAEDMRTQIRAELEEMYSSDAESNMLEDLLNQVSEASEFTEYDEDFYNESYELILSDYDMYVEIFGLSTLDELFEETGWSYDDIESETLSYVKNYIVVYAIADLEGIEIDDDYISDYGEEFAQSAGYDSYDELLEDYTEEEIKFYMLQNEVVLILYENANIE